MSNNVFNFNYNSKLFGLNFYFDKLVEIYNLNKFPKVTLLSGKKGLGKSTLIFHFINYIFDKKNYNVVNHEIKTDTSFNQQLNNSLLPNVIIMKNDSSIKIEDIRLLKKSLLTSTLNNQPRFIILDNIETYNTNSLNALLKIIEEPSYNNFFILINNKEKPLLKTIQSRSLETKIYLQNSERINVINSLINQHKIQSVIDYKNNDLTPGSFLLYNSLCLDNDIDYKTNYITKIHIFLKLYKKTKNILYIKSSIFFTEHYFYELSLNNKDKVDLLIDIKKDIIRKINDLVTYNLNLNLVINSISGQSDYAKE